MDDDYGAPALAQQIAAQPVPAGAVALWWLGQASFAIKGGGATVYVDPYLQRSDRRLTPPPFPPEALVGADLVLLTHDHGDHVDPSALPGIAKASPNARFVAPRPIAGRVAELVGGAERVIAARVDETVAAGGVQILPVPAKHEEFDMVGDDYPYLGYSIRLGGVCVHHSGDTIPFEGQAERVKAHGVDVALLPINGRDFYRTRAGTIGNFDYREAGDYAVQIGADVLVPMHYGMFRGNTVPPGYVVTYLHEFHPEQSVHVMGQFGKYMYAKG
jgi:L-ascorbate metabolism protein UlaG (beta-lactamase superfamily)